MGEVLENIDTQRLADELGLVKQRVDRLERSNRMLKIVNLMAVAGVVAITQIPGIWASAPTTSITAQKFILASAAGKTLATLGVTLKGYPSLTFFDSNGKTLTQVGEAANGESAGLYDYDGNTVLTGTGQVRASVGISSQGAGLEEFDGFARLRLGAGIEANSSGDGIVLYDTNEKARAALSETSAPLFNGFSLALADSNGKIRSSVVVNNTLNSTTYTGFSVLDPNGVTRATLSAPMLEETTGTAGPVLTLNDVAGKPRAEVFANNSSTGYAGLAITAASGLIRGTFNEPLNNSNPEIGFFNSTGEEEGGWLPPGLPE
jgi:hypothetical protein